ncbi:MAG: aminomethyltransferase beta-barrel domain-containing protein [Candidatus Fermentibacteraceae bacterium]
MREALVCLSGGVDSTAAMLICHEEWDSVRAVHLDTRGSGPPCQVRESAEKLGVELIVKDSVDIFRELVRRPAEEAYANGFTPNPCVMCNAKVKLASAHSMLRPGETVVTGHYAGMRNSSLTRARDSGKDQSYFLAMVPRSILSRCAFPLGTLLKTGVREMVNRAGLPFLNRESQDLCFDLPGAGEPGDILTMEGETVGRHPGLGGFTVGQRRGIGAHGRPMYVVRLEAGTNRLYVGEAHHLFAKGCTVCAVNDLGLPVRSAFNARVQLRSRHRAVPAAVKQTPDGFDVIFERPQRAVAPGQAAVFYSDSDDDTVLGAGVISGAEG